MAYTHTRSVRLLQKLKNSPFVKLNNEVYGSTGRFLGASNLAEKTLLANNDFLKVVLPTVLGVDANSGKWQDTVQSYFYSIEIPVPKGGKELDTSLVFDINNKKKQAAIAMLAKDAKVKLDTDEKLAEHVIGYHSSGRKNVDEIDFYKYCTPTNPLEYFNFVYASYHNRVANSQELISKSPRIEFYMVTKEDLEIAKRKKYELSKRITRALLKLDEDVELFDAVCSVLNIKGADEIDKGIALSNLAKDNPTQIIDTMNDKNLLLKATIEGYIRKGIIKRAPNSSMIIDSMDATMIIGSNMEDALTFFSDTKNDATINQYAAKYKSLM